ncbi:hypothetical protein COLO4_04422 [Corchorus olitorius]|uniref:Uncharacterized protein n=1 Tax=Corchorus olitorius TaxID=93759 RepID=A0A1R3KU30_9ROSI|nr:hypothetical protein COLO4_04422 [Corchorus olitorius]
MEMSPSATCISRAFFFMEAMRCVSCVSKDGEGLREVLEREMGRS